MLNLGRIKLPPIKNVLDVAMQTVRQQVPEKPGAPSRPPQNVRFANADMGESCELATMNETTSPTYQSTNPTNPFLSGQLQAEDSFTSYQNTYPQQDGAPRTQSMQSVDFYASSEEGGFEEGGGKAGAKINEFQAAWNVTNAIQGMFVVSLPFAVLQGGYWAIAAMIGIAHICCYTGKILVECLYEDDPVSGQRTPYNIRNHPCCLEPNENLTLAMIIDAFEIYGHDPTDKLDNLWLYQNEMMRIKTAEDQYLINERVHIASDHLGRFIKLHIQELKVLLITLDDVIDNMLAMYENHNAIAAERKATYTGGPVPMEFYLSQEFYCGKNVYLFYSELYSDIYQMGRGIAPYCKDRSFVFLGFLHYHDEKKYYLIDDPSISFPTDNYLHGLECHIGICIFRFPFKKILQSERDVTSLPKAIVKCGLVMYKLPPLSASACIITSGSFILDFNIQGLRYRHYDYLLTTPNGNTYYTKEPHTPLVCDHHVCEWNHTNHYGGPFLIPGDPGTGIDPVPPYIEPTPKPDDGDEDNITVPYILEGCLFMYPPNYGSIAGKSYLDPVELHDDRFTCSAGGGNKGLYWYPQWMGSMPHHPYPSIVDEKGAFDPPGAFYPHQNYEMEDADGDQ